MHLEFGVNMDQRLKQEQRLKQRLDQRLVQKLTLELAPPLGFTWDEPEPMTPVQYVAGKPYLEIQEEDLRGFAKACQEIAKDLDEKIPEAVLVSMRGARPAARAVQGLRSLMPPNVEVYTSYFLKNLGEEVAKGLARSVLECGNVTKLGFIETSVTGAKLSWFLPQLYEVVQKLAQNIGPLEFTSYILHNDKPDLRKHEEEKIDSVVFHRYDIGVPNLICEDSPELLGVKYGKRHPCDERAQEVVSAYERFLRPEIHVLRPGGTDVYVPQKGEKTADLFTRLVVEYANKPS